MKRRYLYVSIFFIFGMLITMLTFFSYRSYKNTHSQPVKSQTNPVDTVKEIRTNTSMKYIVEVYEGVTGVITREESTMPAELAGKTREELEEYFTIYNQEHEGENEKDIPQQKELISFSKDQIVVRENYLSEESMTFFLKTEDGQVVVFHEDQKTPYEYTGIQVDALPEEEQQKLEVGFFVKDEEELYSMLENLSS
ncbi:MAG: BofC C-terminal domain-containing protein [Eubacterium sp.]